MSDSTNEVDKRLPRWQFRKNKKIEKRRNKRQELAKKRPDKPQQEESNEEKEKYKLDKQRWEEREKQFRLIEIAKKITQEKAEEAKKQSQKRWQDTLLNLPMVAPSFSIKQNDDKPPKPTPFKTFVQPRKTYRERYLEQKQAKKPS